MKSHNQMTLMAAAAALAALDGPVDMTAFLPKYKPETGTRLGGGSPAGEVFTDSNGRSYVRDEKGTIRRLS